LVANTHGVPLDCRSAGHHQRKDRHHQIETRQQALGLAGTARTAAPRPFVWSVQLPRFDDIALHLAATVGASKRGVHLGCHVTYGRTQRRQLPLRTRRGRTKFGRIGHRSRWCARSRGPRAGLMARLWQFDVLAELAHQLSAALSEGISAGEEEGPAVGGYAIYGIWVICSSQARNELVL
jgi:hypothetical protein